MEVTINSQFSISERIGHWMELSKLKLALLVCFSSAFGYILGNKGELSLVTLAILVIGGLLISVSSLTLNQIFERDFDVLMKRTMNRPIPTKKISIPSAYSYAVISLLLGVFVLIYFVNPLTGVLSILSWILYAFVYTPLKRIGPIAVFVGAFPGALPPLIGWVAANGYISYEGLILFGIQFIWQFPHFWAIAWVSADDYAKAGFKLLPFNGSKDLKTAINIMIYTLFLLPLGLLPSYFHITGITSGMIATLCGVLFLSQTFMLMRDYSDKSAMKIMFGSFLYLPIVQIAYIVDKI